jgi:DNA-binding CsgD family transcriptional regulator
MLQTITPGKPNLQGAEFLDPTIQPLVAAALAGGSLEPVMLAIVRELGFESFFYAMSTGVRPAHESKSYVWTNLPREWVHAYDKNAYIEVDPRITQTWDRTAPLIWDAATIAGDGKVRQFLEHAAQYGIRSGVAVAFSDARHARYGMTFNSPISPVDEKRRQAIERQLGTLMMLAATFHDLFMVMVVDRGIPSGLSGQPLSPRELQCLKLAAHGMTSGDIGIKLGIAERTANFHFSNILSKLDALNRHEAIAKGMQLGLIQRDL